MLKQLKITGIALLALTMAGCTDELPGARKNGKEGHITFTVLRPEAGGAFTRGDWGYSPSHNGKAMPYLWNTAEGTEAANIIHYASFGFATRDASENLLKADFTVDENNNAIATLEKPILWDAANDHLAAFYPYDANRTITSDNEADPKTAKVDYSVPDVYTQTDKSSAALSPYIFMYGDVKGKVGDVSTSELKLRHLTSMMRFLVINKKGEARTITGVKMTALKGDVAIDLFPSKQTLTFSAPATTGSALTATTGEGMELKPSISVILDGSGANGGTANWNKLADNSNGEPTEPTSDDTDPGTKLARRLATYGLTLATGSLEDVNLKFEVTEQLGTSADPKETTYTYILPGSQIKTKLTADGKVEIDGTGKPIFAPGYYYTFNLELTRRTVTVSIAVPTTKPAWGDDEIPAVNWSRHLKITSGNGSSITNPLNYEVYTAVGLKAVADFINDPSTGTVVAPGGTSVAKESRPYTNITLGKDIDMSKLLADGSGNNWTPINGVDGYYGTFDGNGYTLQKMCIKTSNENQGLIGQLLGTVKNLTLASATISCSESSQGLVVGYNQGTVINCHVTDGSVSGTYNIGGIVGVSNNGGIVGVSNNGGIVMRCTNAASVTGTGNGVGGIAGYNYSNTIIVACSNTGVIKGTKSGGIVGTSEGSLYGCWSIGVTSGTVNGGIAGGINSDNMSGCYTTQSTVVGSGTISTDSNGAGVTDWSANDGNGIPILTNMTNAIAIYSILQIYEAKKCLYAYFPNSTDATQLPVLLPIGTNGARIYEISTAADLNAFRDRVNLGGDNLKLNARVMKDFTISSEDAAWTAGIAGTGKQEYQGVFDGNGKTITGLKVSGGTNPAGLFGTIGSGTVKNLTLKDAVVSSDVVAGIVTGRMMKGGLIENCRVVATSVGSSTVTVNKSVSNNNVGGIVGVASSSIVMGCSNAAAVKIIATEPIVHAGGIVGSNLASTIIACSNTGKVEATGNIASSGPRAGGIVGYNSRNGKLYSCWNTGETSGGIYGGIVANEKGPAPEENGVIEKCYTTQSLGNGYRLGITTNGVAINATQYGEMNTSISTWNTAQTAGNPTCPYRFATADGSIVKQ